MLTPILPVMVLYQKDRREGVAGCRARHMDFLGTCFWAMKSLGSF